MTISTDTTGYLQQEVLRNAKYLVLTVDRYGLVAKQECPGIKWRIEGIDTGRKLPEDLQGIVDSTNGETSPQLIPYVNLQSDLIADVHVLNRGDDRQIILQDVSGGHDDERKLQQKAHEVSLLLEQQAELNLQLDQKKKEAEEASQAKSRFIASMSHEFKSPISSIMLHAERLRAKEPDAREPAAIQRASWYLLTLVDNLLTQARAGESEPQLILTAVDIRRLLNDLQEIFSNQAESRGLQFQVNCSEAVTLLITDEMRLKQVLINLLSNALRYTSDGQIILECVLANGRTRFSVEDTGLGIADSDLERIFKPFVRLNPESGGGTGLGLAISRGLVEAMGGQLEVKSEPGKGSVFSFSLKDADTDAVSSTAGLSGLTVLLVEDDEDLRETYRILLEDWGLKVHTAGDCSSAVEVFRKHPVKLVIADQFLGDGSGTTLIEQFRSENPELKTILCSGAEQTHTSNENIDLLLNKPVSVERLHFSLLKIMSM